MKTEDKKMVLRKMSAACIEGLREDGFTQSQIARVCGVSKQAVNQRILGKRKACRLQLKKRWRRHHIARLYLAGYLTKDIGERFGITEQCVNYHTKGLPRHYWKGR